MQTKKGIKMKNIIKTFALLFVVTFAFMACEDTYESPFNDVSSLTWWVSPSITFNETEKEHSIKDIMIFKDLSRGVISHEWKIPASAKFLSNNIQETDSIYTKFIIPNAGETTTDDIAYVLFTEAGVHEVFLINEFENEVDESVNENGVWKVNKKFTITVSE
jgi:hypothetical protein